VDIHILARALFISGVTVQSLVEVLRRVHTYTGVIVLPGRK